MILTLALAASLLLPQAESVADGNVIVTLPAGWKANRKPDGLFLSPGDLKDGQDYVVIITPGGKSDGNLGEVFEKSWKEFEKSGKVNKAPGKELKTESGVDGLFSVGVVDGDNLRLLISLAVFKAADRYESVMAISVQDPVFAKYSGDLAALMKGLRFKNVELQAGYDLLVTADGRSLYALFKEGSAASALPPVGLDHIDVATAKNEQPASWGTHQTKDGVLTVTIGDKPVALKGQPDGSYKGADGIEFRRAGPSTGDKLDGRFAIEANEKAVLQFKPDGTFADQGGGAAYITPEEAKLNPTSTGTYEIANNTLKLSYKGFTPKLVSFIALPSGNLVLNAQVFKRLP